MSQSTQFKFSSILDREKLNNTNFLDWQRNLRIVLKYEEKESVLDNPLPVLPEGGGTDVERASYTQALKASNEVTSRTSKITRTSKIR